MIVRFRGRVLHAESGKTKAGKPCQWLMVMVPRDKGAPDVCRVYVPGTVAPAEGAEVEVVGRVDADLVFGVEVQAVSSGNRRAAGGL